MAQYSQRSKSSQSRKSGSPAVASYGDYKDRDIAGMTPDAAQEALKPTDAEPVQLQKRMAGCA